MQKKIFTIREEKLSYLRTVLGRILVVALFLSLALAGSQAVLAKPNADVKITYIANAGVMINCAGKTVLIDAHHYQGNPLYERTSWQTLEKMVNAMKPFGRVDLILATHQHGDHFDAQKVGEHLLVNPNTKFLASSQMTDLMEKNFENFEKIEGQIETVTPGWKFSNEITVNGIHVKVLGMKHSSKRFKNIQNMGYIVRIGKYTFLHIGDAETSAANFEAFNLPNEGIDFAFIPYWFLQYDFDEVVNNHLVAGRRIAVHIPPKEIDKVRQEIQKKYPNAIIFSEQLESIEF